MIVQRTERRKAGWGLGRRLGLLGLCLALLSAAAGAQAEPTLATDKPFKLNIATGSCQGIRVAAAGPERLAVGWIVCDGPGAGIYLRQRDGALWGLEQRLAPPEMTQPQDLDLAFDARGRLHLAWTGVSEGGRRLFHARVGSPAEAVAPQALATAPTGDAAADAGADFPILAPAVDGTVVLVWQESQASRFTIRAGRLGEDGGLTDMGLVSGKSFSGMAPQVLSAEPLRVAWHEIQDVGGSLRVDEWQTAEGRWRPSALERGLGALPADNQAALLLTELGPVAGWQTTGAAGRSAIDIGLAQPADAATSGALALETFDEPAGDHTRPNLSGRLPGRLTLAWQVFVEGQQQVRLASILDGGGAPQTLTISSPEQRFAAGPDHVTLGNWSAVVWLDDARDGGSGAVYFSEIFWPAAR